MLRALEIGPGRHPAAAEGDGYSWELVDHPSMRGKSFANHFCQWGAQPIPWPDATFDLVYASHCLEHVPWNRTAHALHEARRVLKPGGVIELWVPDFEFIVQCYVEKRCGDDWRHDNAASDPMTWVNGRLFTYGPEPNFHKAAFDEAHLRRLLFHSGFESIARRRPDEYERGHRHGPISLGMTATRAPDYDDQDE